MPTRGSPRQWTAAGCVARHPWPVVRAGVACGLAVGLLACRPAPDGLLSWSFEGETMGTTYAVTVVDPPPVLEPDALGAAVHETLEAVNAAMSTYDPRSEVSRFNALASAEWFVVSASTFEVLREAREVSVLTGGAFDVTVAPLVDAWGFGPPGRADGLPSPATVAALRAEVGYEHLELDDSTGRVRKTRLGLQIDLSALAKGYAVDQVAERLDGAGIPAYLVEVGGEVRTRGSNDAGRPWRVGIERPTEGMVTLQRVLELVDAALATSGDYRNYVIEAGRRYSHTIDPRTGYPVDHPLAAVSVVDERGIRADALATALQVLGPTAGYDFAIEHGLAALLVSRFDDGSLTERMTPAFRALVADAGP